MSWENSDTGKTGGFRNFLLKTVSIYRYQPPGMNYSKWLQKKIISKFSLYIFQKKHLWFKTAQHTLFSFISTASASCQLHFPNSPSHFLSLKNKNNSNSKVSKSKGGKSTNDGYLLHLLSFQLTLSAMKAT